MKNNKETTPLRSILQNTLVHIENLETNRSSNDKYEKEFQDLKHFSEVLRNSKEFTCIEGEKEFNRKKNRYKDILPFDVSRVILNNYAGVQGSDYINANFIKGASGSPAYIASQGPLPHTVNDFWRMVVECEVQVIVMACNPEEAGKHKCENYWVEKEGEEKKFGKIEICLVKASTVCPDFLVRTMKLKYTNDKAVTEERTVCQFHYSTWPDHGVPPLVRPLLDMVRLVRDTQASETLPVLVHCSAGCGRTGTICAIDFVWGLLRAGKLTEDFSLFNLIKDMRKQRIAMVQTKEQYILVHQAVRELFKEQLHVIESHPYANIDFNGLPLNEPVYDTIDVSRICLDEACDRVKTDTADNLLEEKISSDRADMVPPLPQKKNVKTMYSKKEKDVENMTVKTSCISGGKVKENDSSPTNSLLSKPRIAKLRALFERRSPVSRENNSKSKHSGVSRSHSLGAVKKPLLTEVVTVELNRHDLNKLEKLTNESEGKLKSPKSSTSFSSREQSVPVNSIKRSKSLKLVSSDFLSLGKTSTENKIKHDSSILEAKSKIKEKKRRTENYATVKLIPKEDGRLISLNSKFKRRRSLESLIGDEQTMASSTWPLGSSSGNNVTQSQYSTCPPSPTKHATLPAVHLKKRDPSSDGLFGHFHTLSVEAQKKINHLVSGLGVKERRNSFRQAISSDKKERTSKGSYEYIWTDNKVKYHDKNTIHVDRLTDSRSVQLIVKAQDGTIIRPNEPSTSNSNKKQLTKSFSEQNQKDENILTNKSLDNLKVNVKLEYDSDSKVSTVNVTKLCDVSLNYDSKNRFLKRLTSEIEGEKFKGKSLSSSNNADSKQNCVGQIKLETQRDESCGNLISPSLVNVRMKLEFSSNDSSLTSIYVRKDLASENGDVQNKNFNSTKRNDYQNVCDLTLLKKQSVSCRDVVDGPSQVSNGNSYVNVITNLEESCNSLVDANLTEADFQDHCMWVPPKVTKSYKKNKKEEEKSVYVTSHDLYATVDKKSNQFTCVDVDKPSLASDVRMKKLVVPPESESPSSQSSGDYNDLSLLRNANLKKKDSFGVKKILEPNSVKSDFYSPKKDVYYFPSVITRYEHGVYHDSESSSSSGTRELQHILSTNDDSKLNNGKLPAHKPNPSQMSSKSRDDITLHHVPSISRIKRHASVMIPTNSHNSWKQDLMSRNEMSWSVAPGVDLDAVAASIQHSKSTSQVNRQTPNQISDSYQFSNRQTPNKQCETYAHALGSSQQNLRQTPNKSTDTRSQQMLSPMSGSRQNNIVDVRSQTQNRKQLSPIVSPTPKRQLSTNKMSPIVSPTPNRQLLMNQTTPIVSPTPNRHSANKLSPIVSPTQARLHSANKIVSPTQNRQLSTNKIVSPTQNRQLSTNKIVSPTPNRQVSANKISPIVSPLPLRQQSTSKVVESSPQINFTNKPVMSVRKQQQYL